MELCATMLPTSSEVNFFMTQDKWYRKIIGARTIKTGLATFLTAFFCMALNLNPIYATLTAIVTIEPTAKASLKKAINVCLLLSLVHS